MTCVDALSPFDALHRNLRRQINGVEKRARKSGIWGMWEKLERGTHPGTFAALKGASGWVRDVHTVFKTNWLVVMVRTIDTSWGAVDHAIICTAMNAELRWREKQRIKNECFGPDRIAVEVFPAQDRVVDAADIYHLWVLPASMALPFGIHTEDHSA